ncbi:MAG: hypothetical protein KBD53_02825 [Candidatus Omnitrophica bacterium]|nr:hypothetical protein [Candidatus Omnitrophota bacterium]
MANKIILCLIMLIGAAGCDTVPIHEDLSDFNVHQIIHQQATYPEQETEQFSTRTIEEGENGSQNTNWVQNQGVDLDQQPADYSVLLNFYNTPTPLSIFVIDDIKTFEKKILKIEILSPRQINFVIPKYEVDIFKNTIKSSASNIVRDRIMYRVIYYVHLHPTQAGTLTIPIKNNLFEKDFELTLHVGDSGRSIATMVQDLGFESFLAGNPTEDEVNKKFNKPDFRSALLKDGFRFATYHFDKFYLHYHVLFKDEKVYDVQRLELGQ